MYSYTNQITGYSNNRNNATLRVILTDENNSTLAGISKSRGQFRNNRGIHHSSIMLLSLSVSLWRPGTKKGKIKKVLLY